jgi:hypothetical protein
MGVFPSHHPFSEDFPRFSHYKPTILGIPMTVETSDPSTALDLQNLRALDHRRCALYFAGGAVLKALGR